MIDITDKFQDYYRRRNHPLGEAYFFEFGSIADIYGNLPKIGSYRDFPHGLLNVLGICNFPVEIIRVKKGIFPQHLSDYTGEIFFQIRPDSPKVAELTSTANRIAGFVFGDVYLKENNEFLIFAKNPNVRQIRLVHVVPYNEGDDSDKPVVLGEGSKIELVAGLEVITAAV